MIRKYFCFNLFTAGLIVGWIGLAGSLIQIISNILVLDNIDSVITPQNFPNITDLVPVRTFAVSVLSIAIVLRVIDILASGLLIAGAIKRSHLLLLPWLINSTISLLFSSLTMLLLLMYFVSTDYTQLIPFNLSIIIVFGVYVYTYIAIYSLYSVIRDNNRSNEYSRLIGDGDTRYPTYTNDA